MVISWNDPKAKTFTLTSNWRPPEHHVTSKNIRRWHLQEITNVTVAR